jgi:hypothetical protein
MHGKSNIKLTLTCFRSYVVYGFIFLALGSLLMTKYQTFLGSFWSDCFTGVTFLAKVNSFIISPLKVSTCGFLLTGRACHVWLDGTHYRRVGEVAYADWRRLLSIDHKHPPFTCMCNFSWDIYRKEYAHLHTAFKVSFWTVLTFVKFSLLLFLTRPWCSWYVCNVSLSVLCPPWGLAFETFNSIFFNLLLNGYESLAKESSLFLAHHTSFIVLTIPLHTNSSYKNQFLCRPWETVGVSGGWDFHISRKSALKGSQVFNPTHQPLLPRKFTLYSLLLAAQSTSGP